MFTNMISEHCHGLQAFIKQFAGFMFKNVIYLLKMNLLF